jgi:hypothetical protein
MESERKVTNFSFSQEGNRVTVRSAYSWTDAGDLEQFRSTAMFCKAPLCLLFTTRLPPGYAFPLSEKLGHIMKAISAEGHGR